MTMVHYRNGKMENIPKVDELKMSWDEFFCKTEMPLEKLPQWHKTPYDNKIQYLV